VLVLDRQEKLADPGLPLTAEHAVDGPRTMLDKLLGDERSAVPADADEAAGPGRLDGLGEVHYLRDIREVIAREGYDLRCPALDQSEQIAVGLDL